METVGLRGAPRETFAALQEALKGVNLPEAIVVYITDWQDQRTQARYAVYILEGKRRVLSRDAFGPRFGPEGERALHELTRWLLEQGASQFKEAVLPPSEYAVLLEAEPSAAHLLLLASANPTDPALYLKPTSRSR